MLRRTLLRRQGGAPVIPPGREREARTWKQKVIGGLSDLVKKTVPDPRKDPLADRPVGYEDYKKDGSMGPGGMRDSFKDEESMEDYLRTRNAKWAKKNIEDNIPDDPKLREEIGVHVLKDGKGLFIPTGDKEIDADVEKHQKAVDAIEAESYHIDEEKLKLRQQLAVDNAQEYRKFVSEMKRSELQEQQSQRRRQPHPADPKYDPFKATPGYRPQDSSKLAQWLKRQRESGLTASGASLSSREGQERFYQEEKMATQYHANPWANHIEVPAGTPKMTITHLSPDSICIDDKEVIGSIIVTSTRYYHWNASTIEDINKRSLAMLLHMYPVPDVVFIGTGRNLYMIEEDLRLEFLKRGTVTHCMTTREACSTFGLQLTSRRRTACALLSCVPTNPYGKECFGDFIENDSYCLSDTQLGIPVNRQFNPNMYRTNKVAEKYRHMQGTGVGPKYHQLADGRLVKPGTAGTKLRPMIEPGENIEWEKLPSFYHWFPKERVEDYIEKNTWRECANMTEGSVAENRVKQSFLPNNPHNAAAEQAPKVDLPPWDSNTIPMPKWQYEKNEGGEHIVEDPKTGRAIGMNKDTFDRWKTMMDRREALDAADAERPLPEEEEVEYDQEQIVSDRTGRLMDFSKMPGYQPMIESRWHPKAARSMGGRGKKDMPQ